MSEVDLASKVITWLEKDGWDVYQEVDDIDIVALRSPVSWAIECKLSMGFSVLEQAVRRTGRAHCIWVATPYRKSNYKIARLCCEKLGIGWITVAKNTDYIQIQCYPNFQRRLVRPIKKYVRPEHKTYAKAGSPSNRSWTPFKATCRELKNLVILKPGITLKEAITNISHHYSSNTSARSSLTNHLLRGIIDGVRFERNGKKILLYPS